MVENQKLSILHQEIAQYFDKHLALLASHCIYLKRIYSKVEIAGHKKTYKLIKSWSMKNHTHSKSIECFMLDCGTVPNYHIPAPIDMGEPKSIADAIRLVHDLELSQYNHLLKIAEDATKLMDFNSLKKLNHLIKKQRYMLHAVRETYTHVCNYKGDSEGVIDSHIVSVCFDKAIYKRHKKH